jgi:hypothetical protein
VHAVERAFGGEHGGAFDQPQPGQRVVVAAGQQVAAALVQQPAVQPLVLGRPAVADPGQAGQVAIALLAPRGLHLRALGLAGVRCRDHRLQRRARQRMGLPAAGQVTQAVADLVGGHQLERAVDQLGAQRFERALGGRVAAHRQHELAAAVDEGQRQRRQPGRGLRLDHDVQRQPGRLGMLQHRQRAAQPACLGGAQVGGRRRRGQARAQREQPRSDAPGHQSLRSWANHCAAGPLSGST